MKDISDLIDYENENSSLDFKAIQYKKDKYESLLKDIMSLANSISKDDKFIIIGVKHYPNGNRDLLGIEDNFIDDATYQQIIDSNIEPQIGLSYFPFNHNQKIFGIFQITDCSNPPYMMKKDYGNLKSGDSFIRKGSYQTRLTRKDIDNHIYLKEQSSIPEDIFISLNDDNIVKEIKLTKNIQVLPSEITKAKVEQIISSKEKQAFKIQSSKLLTLVIPNYNVYSYTTNYEDRDLETLKSDLLKVKDKYAEQDEFYINETNAYKLNFYIHNNTNKFLEDASVEILINHSKYFKINDHIYDEPEYYNPTFNNIIKTASWEQLNYPIVETKNKKYRTYHEIGNIKHHVPKEALDVPLRLVILNYDVEIVIEMSVKIFAKNLRNPICDILRIII